jgi:hypothetical protein
MSTKVKETVRLKREQAEDRQKHRATLTPQQQLDRLTTRPGESLKERARLNKLITSHE